MDRGRRAMYTTYLECHYQGEIVYIRCKARHRKKDGWNEFRVVSRNTFQKAKNDGYPVNVVEDEKYIPWEVVDEVKKRQQMKKAAAGQ